jgi:hypothetical protein
MPWWQSVGFKKLSHEKLKDLLSEYADSEDRWHNRLETVRCRLCFMLLTFIPGMISYWRFKRRFNKARRGA